MEDSNKVAHLTNADELTDTDLKGTIEAAQVELMRRENEKLIAAAKWPPKGYTIATKEVLVYILLSKGTENLPSIACRVCDCVDTELGYTIGQLKVFQISTGEYGLELLIGHEGNETGLFLFFCKGATYGIGGIRPSIYISESSLENVAVPIEFFAEITLPYKLKL